MKYEDNFFYKLSFKISEWSCEKFGNEIDLETVKKEELNDLLRWFYAEVQPKEKENKNQEYHKNTMKGIRSALNRHLSDIGRDVDIVHDKTFKQANGILQGKLKQNMQLGLSKPTQHKPIITQNDLQKFWST